MFTLTRRKMLGMGAALAAGASLTGCTSPFDDTTAGGGRTLEFVTFYTGPDGAIMQEIVNRYNAQSDGARIRMSAPAHGADYLTKLLTACIAGNPPAIMALHSYEIPPLRRFLHSIDLTSLGLHADEFVPGTMELGMVDDLLLGVTMSTGPQAMAYNRRLFTEAGLDPDDPPRDAASFVEMGRAITETGPWGFLRDTADWMPWLSLNWQNGGELLDGDRALFDSAAAVEAIEMERSWVHDEQISPRQLIEGTQLGRLFQDGEAGMMFIGPWGLAPLMELNEEQGTSFDIAPIPAFFDAEPAVAATSHLYSIPKQRNDDDWIRAEAEKFIAWVVREGSATWARAQAPASTAARAEMEASDDPTVTAMQTYVEEQTRARFVPYAPRWNLAFSYLVNATQSIVYRDGDPAALMRQAAEQATAAIQGARR